MVHPAVGRVGRPPNQEAPRHPLGAFLFRGHSYHGKVKRTASALLLAALPCSADRIIELRAKDQQPATYQVPEGRLVSLLGRSFEESTPTRGSGFEVRVVMIREGTRFTNAWLSFQEIGHTVAGPAEVTVRNTVPIPGLNKDTAFVLLREWEPVPTPAETTPVVPAGSGAVLTLETSSDLTAWQPALGTNLPAVGTNRFFRLRLEPAR